GFLRCLGKRCCPARIPKLCVYKAFLLSMKLSPGKSIGKWTVLSITGRLAVVQCKCGTVRTVYFSQLATLNNSGCSSCSRSVHGHTASGKQSPEYMAYRDMLKRCHDPNNKRYADYGGRGISVCSR